MSERCGFGIHCNILIEEPNVSVFTYLLDPRYKMLNHEKAKNVQHHIGLTVKSLIQSYEKMYKKDQGKIIKSNSYGYIAWEN